MSQSLSNILIHLVFSTKNRLPLIQTEHSEELYKYITGICRNLECPLHQIGGIEDHIHILLSLSRKIALFDLVGKIKSNSSHRMKKFGKEYQDFAWQNGYGGFSIGASVFDVAVQYIANQREHHKQISFQDEYRILLKKYNVNYDERYVWG